MEFIVIGVAMHLLMHEVPLVILGAFAGWKFYKARRQEKRNSAPAGEN